MSLKLYYESFSTDTRMRGALLTGKSGLAALETLLSLLTVAQ